VYQTVAAFVEFAVDYLISRGTMMHKVTMAQIRDEYGIDVTVAIFGGYITLQDLKDSAQTGRADHALQKIGARRINLGSISLKDILKQRPELKPAADFCHRQIRENTKITKNELLEAARAEGIQKMAGLFGSAAFTMGKFKQTAEGGADSAESAAEESGSESSNEVVGGADSAESAAEESGSAGSASPGERHAMSRQRRKRHKMMLRQRPTRASPGDTKGEDDMHAGDNDAGSAAGGTASPAQRSPVLSPSHGLSRASGSPSGGGRGPSPCRERSADWLTHIAGRSPTCSPRRLALEEKEKEEFETELAKVYDFDPKLNSLPEWYVPPENMTHEQLRDWCNKWSANMRAEFIARKQRNPAAAGAGAGGTGEEAAAAADAAAVADGVPAVSAAEALSASSAAAAVGSDEGTAAALSASSAAAAVGSDGDGSGIGGSHQFDRHTAPPSFGRITTKPFQS
jgi:hypothetical protein